VKRSKTKIADIGAVGRTLIPSDLAKVSGGMMNNGGGPSGDATYEPVATDTGQMCKIDGYRQVDWIC
jgi:hypothetical protein